MPVAGAGGETLVHELAITESIVATVRERIGTRRVERVTLLVGRLAGVVPDSVEFCFELCARGTTLEGAELEIIQVDGRGRCRQCGKEFTLRDLVILCPCGSADVQITAGEELRIKQVEVAA
ncbi:MAG: hydrogenase maturation nickel metallochaperone HypA [Acidimicrobiales bacterium]